MTAQESKISYQKVNQFIYQYCGMAVSPEKLRHVVSELSEAGRLFSAIEAIDEYQAKQVEHITSHLYDITNNTSLNSELQMIINLVTVNETYFFREADQIHYVIDNYILPRNRAGLTTNILSAGCSTGAEPYTMAILLKEKGLLNSCHFYACDINTKTLAKAKKRVYSSLTFRDDQYALLRDKYFIRTGNEWVLQDQDIVASTTFFCANLLMLSTWLKYDIIFCRNVLIYFGNINKEIILLRLYNHLNKGGYLVLSKTESLFSIEHRFGHEVTEVGSIFNKLPGGG